MTALYKDITALKDKRKSLKAKSIGFVPTLGGLHAGHIALIKKSLAENSTTVVSIFLNPAQFNDPSDLEKYPSTWEEDFSILKQLNVDIVFSPDKNQIYHDDYTYKIIETAISNDLCGAARPGHMNGVLTVVMKLLNIVKPDKAYFGEKDYQQYLLVKNMVHAFFMDTEIFACPTVREESGLALSSRNRRLSDKYKNIAPKLYATIRQKKSIDEMRAELMSYGFKIDYLTKKWDRVFVAAFLDDVRLIDNVPA